MPAERLVKVPRGVSDEQAAALMLKGLTAHFLIRRTHKVQRGDTILVHAAAGGVGLILCQWAKALGAKVIGVVGSDAKAEIARKHGCRHVLISGRDELVAERQGASPAARASRQSTTPSARTRSWTRSTACAAWASW